MQNFCYTDNIIDFSNGFLKTENLIFQLNGKCFHIFINGENL